MNDRRQLRASTTPDYNLIELRFERTRAASRGEDTRHFDAELAKHRTMSA